MPELVAKIDFRFSSFAIGYRLGEWATLHAQRAPILIHMHQKVIEATPANHFTGQISGQVFCAFVPVRDSSLSIDEVHGIVQAIKQLFVERRDGVTRRIRFRGNWFGN